MSVEMPSGARIGEASTPDIPLLAAVIRDSFRDVAESFGLTRENCPTHPSFCTDIWIAKAMDEGVRFFALEIGGEVCGCVALERAGDEVCYLERLAVKPAYRNMGYGAMLVERVMEEARAGGALRLEAGIISQQRKLRDWYGRLGFVVKGVKRFDHLPFEVAFMARQL